MINMTLGNYRIESQENCIVLFKTCTNEKADSKNYGQSYETTIGYFPNLTMAMIRCTEDAISNGEKELTDMSDVLSAIEELKTMVRAVAEQMEAQNETD